MPPKRDVRVEEEMKGMGERLRLWRAFSGVTIKPMSNRQLVTVVKNEYEGSDDEMQRIMHTVREYLCYGPKSPLGDGTTKDYINNVYGYLNDNGKVEFHYEGCEALIALSHNVTGRDEVNTTVEGVIVFGPHDIKDIRCNELYCKEAEKSSRRKAGFPLFQWAEPSLDKLDLESRLAEIYLVCKRMPLDADREAPAVKGLGPYLISEAMYRLAKRKKQSRPRYSGIVSNMAHGCYTRRFRNCPQWVPAPIITGSDLESEGLPRPETTGRGRARGRARGRGKGGRGRGRGTNTRSPSSDEDTSSPVLRRGRSTSLVRRSSQYRRPTLQSGYGHSRSLTPVRGRHYRNTKYRSTSSGPSFGTRARPSTTVQECQNTAREANTLLMQRFGAERKHAVFRNTGKIFVEAGEESPHWNMVITGAGNRPSTKFGVWLPFENMKNLLRLPKNIEQLCTIIPDGKKRSRCI